MTGIEWPDSWRAVHVSGATLEEVRHALSLFPATRSVLTIDDGDCGDVWGETLRDGCRMHVTAWCHRFDTGQVAFALSALPVMIVGTDPNVWSEKQVVYRQGIAHPCVHTRASGVSE